jgi:predicted DNA-binding transcriptional regulator AlpA
MTPRSGSPTNTAAHRTLETKRPAPDELPPGVVPVSPPPDSLSGRLTLRLDEVAATLGVSRRAIERLRSAGRFPPPDLTIGRMPLWRPETIRAWIEGGGRCE